MVSRLFARALLVTGSFQLVLQNLDSLGQLLVPEVEGLGFGLRLPQDLISLPEMFVQFEALVLETRWLQSITRIATLEKS